VEALLDSEPNRLGAAFRVRMALAAPVPHLVYGTVEAQASRWGKVGGLNSLALARLTRGMGQRIMDSIAG
jgi:hypothetical protein